jgi:hypothetical protein
MKKSPRRCWFASMATWDERLYAPLLASDVAPLFSLNGGPGSGSAPALPSHLRTRTALAGARRI